MFEALALWLAQAPAPQPACGPRQAIIEQLADRYSEAQRSLGLSREGVVEVWYNEETRTFTILLSKPDGTTCLVSSGEAWMQNVEPLDKPGREL